jgi:beta-galactosidase
MFGNYNNPEQPQVGVYKKKIKTVPGCDSVVLELKEFYSLGRIYIDGLFVKTIQPMDSTVTLDQVSGKTEFELAIYLEMKTIQESIKARLYLYHGTHAADITFNGADEKDINSYLEKIQAADLTDIKAVKLSDVFFYPGETAVLTGSFHLPEEEKQSICMKIHGQDAKVLVVLNGILLGRLWLPSEHTRPFFKGGNDEILFLPAGFLKEENQLDLIVEGIEGEPSIKKLEFEIIYNRML